MSDNLSSIQEKLRGYFAANGDDGDQRAWRDLKESHGVDPLTGFLNRKAFEERVLSSIGRDRAYTLIIFDLDGFKKINDTYGHFAGDLVIKNTADIVRNHVRNIDIVCRWGGEEVIVVCPDVVDEAESVAERLRSSFESTQITYKDKIINRTASFGVAVGSGTDNLQDIIGQADAAMYQAKQSGRNQVKMA